MEGLLQDTGYALRVLRRNPGFTVVAVLALALGIGASSAIFSVVNAVVLRPLPYANPEGLVQLWMRFTGIGIPDDRNWVSAPEFADLQHNDSLASSAAISSASFNITFGSTPERIEAALVTPDLFRLLGARVQKGRVFLPEEGRVGRDNVVLLGDGLWRRRFGADPHVVGRKLLMNGRPYTVVGVLERGFQFPRDAEVWTPLAFSAADLTADERGNHGLQVVARIKPGLTVEQVRADLARVARRIVADHPDYPYARFNFTVLVVPLLEQQIGDVKTALWVLCAAVGFVLLIACMNVASLLLVRAAGRTREIAVRQALGVSRTRLLRQLVTESVVLGLCGGAGGLLLACWALQVLVTLSATAFPRMAEVHLDTPVLLFTLVVSLTTGILFGLAPAFTISRTNPHGTLKEGGRGGSATISSQRLRSALVVVEIALSLTLLAGAGLLIRSFLRLQDVDAGFRAEGVLTLRLALPEQKYTTAHQSITFYRTLLDRLRHLPGVDAAGAVTGLPLSGTGWSGTVTIDTTAVTGPDASPEADQRPITPGYFEALHIPLLQGRYPTDQDNETAAPICLVDETLARKYWPNSDPLGHRLHRGGTESKSPWMTVIGVLRPVRYRTLESPSRVAVYWPHAQSTFPINTLSVAIHTTADPQSLIDPIRRAVLAQDPDQPIYRIQTLSAVVGDSLARRRLSMLLLALFAAVALFLAGIGLYGLISQSVAQRSHELGIRLALGARRAELLRLVLGQSAVLATGGILLGLASSMLLTRFITTLLFAVNPYDPLTFVAVAGLLLLISGAAALAPAYRASTVDPVEVLRKE